jgi:protein-disulfide isomerase
MVSTFGENMDKNERSSKRENIKKRSKKNQKREQVIFLSALLLLVLIIGGTLIYSSLQSSKEVITTITPSYRAETNGFSTGDPNAPVKVQEFADFQCPGCQYFALSVEPVIQSKYIDTGQVYFTYTPFSFIGQESIAAAEAAYCADD